MSNKSKIETGAYGETMAANFFHANGFEIVARNYRFRHSEIDLIVKKDDWLLFVEVKTRSSSSYGEPEEFVDARQVNKLFEAAEEFIYANDWQGNIRFDIVSVKLGTKPEIIHFEDAIN